MPLQVALPSPVSRVSHFAWVLIKHTKYAANPVRSRYGIQNVQKINTEMNPGRHQFSDTLACNNKSTGTLTQLAAGRLKEIRQGSLTREVNEKAVLCLIDFLGALISGLQAPWSPGLLQYARISSSGVAHAHVVGLEAPVSAEVAAFTNATIAHR